MTKREFDKTKRLLLKNRKAENNYDHAFYNLAIARRNKSAEYLKLSTLILEYDWYKDRALQGPKGRLP